MKQEMSDYIYYWQHGTLSDRLQILIRVVSLIGILGIITLLLPVAVYQSQLSGFSKLAVTVFILATTAADLWTYSKVEDR
jgi:hypothetical protein